MGAVKPKVEDLEFEPKQAFENLRVLAAKVLNAPKSAIQSKPRKLKHKKR